MLFPVGRIKYENLSSSFTNFDELVDELKENRFDGYLKVNFWSYSGYLIFDTGRMAQGFEFTEDLEVFGREAVVSISLKSKEKGGTFSVHEIENETVLVLLSLSERILYKDGVTDQENSISSVIDELQEHELTAFVDLKFGVDKGRASIYLHDGIPVECIIQSNSGNTLRGIEIYEKVIALSQKIKTRFKVYKGDLLKAIEMSADVRSDHGIYELVKMFSDIFATVEYYIDDELKREGAFVSAMETMCSKLKDAHDFLDPVKGILSYYNGRFSFTGNETSLTVNKGLQDLLNQTFKTINVENNNKISRAGLLHYMEPRLELHREVLAKHNIDQLIEV